MLKNRIQLCLFLFGASLFGIATVNAKEPVKPAEEVAVTTLKSSLICATDTEKVREMILISMAVTTASSQPFCLSGGFGLVPYTAVEEVMPNNRPAGCFRSPSIGP